MSTLPSKWQILGAAAKGIAVAALFAAMLKGGITYVAPARVVPSKAAARAIVEPKWIKVPFDIVRTKECLSQSTVTLTRFYDYGAELGRREDKVTLGLYNTTITGLGAHQVMLWFRRPEDVWGKWTLEAKAQDDCGGFLDLSIGKPREAVAEGIDLGPEP